MRQNEDRMMEWRIFTPSTIPQRFSPIASNGAEHVAANDGGADGFESRAQQVTIGTLGAAGLAVQFASGSRLEDPFVQYVATSANRSINILIGTRHEAVERNRDGMNAHFGHDFPVAM